MKQRVEKQIGKEILWFETGELAKQAAGACLCGYGDSSVIATVTIADAKEGQDFFPLTVSFEEKLHTINAGIMADEKVTLRVEKRDKAEDKKAAEKAIEDSDKSSSAKKEAKEALERSADGRRKASLSTSQ